MMKCTTIVLFLLRTERTSNLIIVYEPLTHPSGSGVLFGQTLSLSDQMLPPGFARDRVTPVASRTSVYIVSILRTGMEWAYWRHFFIFSLGSCRVVKKSLFYDFYRNECTSVCPHLNHIVFIKLEPGFEPSDAFLISQGKPYRTL